MKRSAGIRTRSLVSALGFFVAVAASGAVVGCNDADPNRAGASWQTSAAANDGSGSIALELTTPSGVTFTSFTYAIVGPNFTKGGSIDVSHSTTISALIDGLPPGAGYTLTLMGTAAAPNAASCTGSAPFTVTAGTVSDVSVTLSCRVSPPPPPPSAVPVPPYAPVALAFVLLGLGTFAVRRREAT
ncbi:MAG TPA: hypothetical protein VMI54_17415 [Polyangiaceae bacterium]|nr:hypothetical protein [Polyangiaceae bacterium]